MNSALCFAVLQQDVKQVQALIASGADVNALGSGGGPAIAGSTPLWLATNLAGQEIADAWKQLSAALTEAYPTIPPRNHDAIRGKLLLIISVTNFFGVVLLPDLRS